MGLFDKSLVSMPSMSVSFGSMHVYFAGIKNYN